MIAKGSVMMLKIGLTIKNNIERTAPPIKYVVGPPEILSPVIICDVKKRAKE